jgi:hypothetical protein
MLGKHGNRMAVHMKPLAKKGGNVYTALQEW